jgi:transcriptional regulator with AAA-type ATPase domain
MITSQFLNDIEQLPPEAQQKIAAFIIKQDYYHVRTTTV